MSNTPEWAQMQIRAAQVSQADSLDLTGRSNLDQQLTEVPAELFELTHLKYLNLQGNRLAKLPSDIGQLKELISLNMSSNQLTALPDAIDQLKQLKSLYIRYNQLATLPDSIAGLKQLNSLDGSGNRFVSLPHWLGELDQLSSLQLSHNQFVTLPDSLGRVKQLALLKVLGNQLTNLPDWLGQLKKLTWLDVSENKLTTLPSWLSQLTQLTKLYVMHNLITELPEWLVHLKYLKELDASGNPITEPPPEDVAKGIAGIRSYYLRLEAEGIALSYEAKLLILGEGNAGKTTLRKKIENLGFVVDPTEQTTHGVEVSRWQFTTPDSHEFRVNVWDFGGQEIFHATHQFFLTKRSLYVLVADERAEDTNYHYWLNIAHTLGEDSPILILKNEKQGRAVPLNLKQFTGDMALVGPEALDLATPDVARVRRMVEEIKHQLMKLPHVGSKIPPRWKRVRDALET